MHRVDLDSLIQSKIQGSERCVSWNFTLQNWTTEGCTTNVSQDGIVTCSCNHLTNFAILVVSNLLSSGYIYSSYDRMNLSTCRIYVLDKRAASDSTLMH